MPKGIPFEMTTVDVIQPHLLQNSQNTLFMVVTKFHMNISYTKSFLLQ